jgi:hypothetical protein
MLIAHAELMHHHWRTECGSPAGPDEALGDVRDRHADCVAALRNRSLRVIARSHQSRVPRP